MLWLDQGSQNRSTGAVSAVVDKRRGGVWCGGTPPLCARRGNA